MTFRFYFTYDSESTCTGHRHTLATLWNWIELSNESGTSLHFNSIFFRSFWEIYHKISFPLQPFERFRFLDRFIWFYCFYRDINHSSHIGRLLWTECNNTENVDSKQKRKLIVARLVFYWCALEMTTNQKQYDGERSAKNHSISIRDNEHEINMPTTKRKRSTAIYCGVSDANELSEKPSRSTKFSGHLHHDVFHTVEWMQWNSSNEDLKLRTRRITSPLSAHSIGKST